jgi:hypothetical protein
LFVFSLFAFLEDSIWRNFASLYWGYFGAMAFALTQHSVSGGHGGLALYRINAFGLWTRVLVWIVHEATSTFWAYGISSGANLHTQTL